MQCLQVELIRGLRRHELHRRPLHRLGDCLRIVEVVLSAPWNRAERTSPASPGIVAKRFKLATEMMCADAGLHADQARRHVSKAGLDLAARPFLAQHDGATSSWPTMWNEFLPISMPITEIAALSVWDMACSLALAPPSQHLTLVGGRSTAGPFHYRIDHTLVEMLRLRMFAIAAGYEDSNDCTTLRYDPVFKWRSVALLRAARRCARSQPCRGWRTRRAGPRLRG